jgi:hypothetical protein
METKLPIIVGITGHRDLRKQDLDGLRALVKDEMQKLKETYPHSPFVLLDSLAEGADQLCAEIGLELGFSLFVPLPLALEEYRKDFSGAALKHFDTLLSAASEVFVVPNTEAPVTIADSGDKSGEAPGRNYGYRQAGIYVCTHCHLLLALWDGSPPIPGGCGTAETVDFMLHTSYIPSKGSLLSAVDEGALLHINSLREGQELRNPVDEALGTSNALGVRWEDHVPGSLPHALAATDRFNAEPESSDSAPLIRNELIGQLNPRLKQLHALYQKADARSIFCRDRYLSGMKWLSVMGVMLVLAFLLYEELNYRLMLPFYAAVLLFSYFLLYRAKHGLWHSRYLEYRALSETLRVQFYQGLCGIQSNLCDSFTWSQKIEVAWVKKAIGALLAGPPWEVPVDGTIMQEVKIQWIDHQLEYHKGKLGSTGRRVDKNRKVAFAMFLITIVVFLWICVMEIFFPQLLFSGFLNINGKNVALITLGLLSSVTLFLSNYYGKLSLERKTSDHEKMAALYEAAQKKWTFPESTSDQGVTPIPVERIAMELAREEIIENGVWLSYSRDSAPSVNL